MNLERELKTALWGRSSAAHRVLTWCRVDIPDWPAIEKEHKTSEIHRTERLWFYKRETIYEYSARTEVIESERALSVGVYEKEKRIKRA